MRPRPLAIESRCPVRMVKKKSTASVVAAGLLWAALPAAAQVAPDARGTGEQAAEQARERGVRLTFDRRPSIRIGRVLRLDFRLKSQADWQDLSSPSASTDEDAFDLHRLRVGIEGTVLRRLEYQVEREMRDSRGPWRDAS